MSDSRWTYGSKGRLTFEVFGTERGHVANTCTSLGWRWTRWVISDNDRQVHWIHGYEPTLEAAKLRVEGREP